MALVKCRDCEKQLSTDAKRCPNCGARNPYYKSAWSMVWKVLLALLVVCFLFIGYGCIKIAKDPEAAERARMRDAIDYCEREHEKLEADPSMRSALWLSKATCEKLRSDFREKWKRDP